MDVGDKELLERRSWRWMRTRILGLLSTKGSRIQRHFSPPEKTPKYR